MPGKPLYVVTYHYEEGVCHIGDYFGPATLETYKEYMLDVFDRFYNVVSVHCYEIREIDVTKGEDDIHE